MKVLITGATGFAGSHLADYLVGEGLEVYGAKRPRSRGEFVNGAVQYVEADITDYTSVAQAIKKVEPDYLFHLAAQSYVPLSWKAPQATFTTNAIGTVNILEAVRRESPDTVVQVAGSSEEYGLAEEGETPMKETNPLRPQSPYGVSKVAADLFAQQYYRSYGLKVVVTRAFNHTGPRRGEVFATSSFAKQLAEIEEGKEPTIYVGNLSAQRDWVDVRDVVKAYWLAANKCEYGEAYNICSGHVWSIGEMLNILLSHVGKKIRVIRDEDRMRPSDVLVLLGDCSKFKKATGWGPTIEFGQTMLDLLNYWRLRVE